MTELREHAGPAAARPSPIQGSPPPRPTDRRLRWVLSLAGLVVVSGIAVWMISPRFEIDTPSVVDDWSALYYSEDLIGDVLRLSNPETERFRPGVIVWTYLQWHTFDAPGGIVGPNAWNVLRALILVAGLALVTALALPVRRGRLEAVLFAALVAIPGLVVVLVPKFARDLARFGPQEPLLVGGMALGGGLLFLAVRALLRDRPLGRTRVAALVVAGGLLWMLGVYQKETSVCVLPLLAAVLVAGRAELATSWPALARARKRALGAIAAVVVLPLAHVVVELLRIVARGDLVYDAEVSGGRGLARGVRDLYDWAHEAMPGEARLLIWSAIVLTVVAALVRRRVDWIALGALLSGALSFVFAGQSGVLATRYYIPLLALFAVAFVLSLARLPAPVQLAGVLAVLLAFTPPPGTRAEVQSWTDEELANQGLVQEAARWDGSGCLVASGGLDQESGLAIPILVGLERREANVQCGDAVLLVTGPGPQGVALREACAAGALELVREGHVGSAHVCGSLRAEPVRDPDFGLVEPEQLVQQRRLLPARFG